MSWELEQTRYVEHKNWISFSMFRFDSGDSKHTCPTWLEKLYSGLNHSVLFKPTLGLWSKCFDTQEASTKRWTGVICSTFLLLVRTLSAVFRISCSGFNFFRETNKRSSTVVKPSRSFFSKSFWVFLIFDIFLGWWFANCVHCVTTPRMKLHTDLIII